MLSGTKKLVLIALFTALLVVLVNAVWWFNYRQTEIMLDHQLSHRLAAVARASAMMFRPDEVEALMAGHVDTYADAISQLETVRQGDSLSEVFIIDENYHYLATTTIETDSTYFLSGLHGPLIDSLLFSLGDAPVLTPTYRSGSLYLKTAFAPLKGLDQYVIAVLGVEANVDYFDSLAQLRRNLYYASGLSLLGGILLGFIFLLLQRRISRAEEKLFLQETHSHLGRMVAVVSHEIKNPLMIMRAAAERLKKKTEFPEAGFVVEEVDRLNGIVSGYLDFARAGGSLVSNDGPLEIDLAELLESTRAHLVQKYSDMIIEWLNPEKFPEKKIMGYPRSLRQVILNLLINGVEACREAGQPAQVGLELRENGDRIEIIVRDRGPGFAPRDLKRAFEPFYSSKRTGSGLGLYLSRTIVRQMGGDIEIKSGQAETDVIVSLPENQEKAYGQNTGSR